MRGSPRARRVGRCLALPLGTYFFTFVTYSPPPPGITQIAAVVIIPSQSTVTTPTFASGAFTRTPPTRSLDVGVTTKAPTVEVEELM